MIDKRNTVIIIGKQQKDSLEQWFGRSNNYGNHFWLAAESGYLYRPGGKEWQKLTDNVNQFGWISQVKKIMQNYMENVDGSFVEQRDSCIAWNYKNAEIEHGNMFVKDLDAQLKKVIEDEAAEIIHGNGYLEVKPQGIKKVSSSSHI